MKIFIKFYKKFLILNILKCYYSKVFLEIYKKNRIIMYFGVLKIKNLIKKLGIFLK